MDKTIENVEATFKDLWPRIRRRNLVDFAEEFTDMIAVGTKSFVSIYLLGVTRTVEDMDTAWNQAAILLEQILLGEVNF